MSRKELKVVAGIHAGIAGIQECEISAIEYLQSIYRDPLEPTSVRMRAAMAAIPFESPKLAVIGHVGEDGTIAERLDRALARSKVRVIAHQPTDEDQR
jgi:hypothetical protein